MPLGIASDGYYALVLSATLLGKLIRSASLTLRSLEKTLHVAGYEYVARKSGEQPKCLLNNFKDCHSYWAGTRDRHSGDV